MKGKDIIWILLVIVFIVVLFYFAIWKHRNEPCHGCPFAKTCKKTCDRKNQKKKNNNATIS